MAIQHLFQPTLLVWAVLAGAVLNGEAGKPKEASKQRLQDLNQYLYLQITLVACLLLIAFMIYYSRQRGQQGLPHLPKYEVSEVDATMVNGQDHGKKERTNLQYKSHQPNMELNITYTSTIDELSCNGLTIRHQQDSTNIRETYGPGEYLHEEKKTVRTPFCQ